VSVVEHIACENRESRVVVRDEVSRAKIERQHANTEHGQEREQPPALSDHWQTVAATGWAA